jgi:RimJ/RimL family protein N-acetyltransferase
MTSFPPEHPKQPSSLRWMDFLPGDGPPLQTLLEQDPEFFEQTYGYPPGAEAENLLYSAPEGRSPDDKYVVLWRPTSLAPFQAVAELVPNYPADRTWWVGFFFVDAAARRRGIGEQAARDLLSWLAECGAETVQCSAAAIQTGALALAKKLGFENLRTETAQLGSRTHTLQRLSRHVDR